MKTTIQRYNDLCDMNLINKQNYDINARVSMIIQEVQDLLDKYEQEARAMLGYDKKTAKQDETKLVSYMRRTNDDM